jgi:hypothetical protein
MRRHGSYGIDAPRWLAVPFALIVGSVVQAVLTSSVWPLVGAAVILVCVGIGFHSSWRGKFAVWDEQLSSLSGAEEVLDLGCGRGAVLIAAARGSQRCWLAPLFRNGLACGGWRPGRR